LHKYLITSKEFYTDTPSVFCTILYEKLKEYMPTYVLYRDKLNPNYNTQAAHFVEICSKFESIKSFIHQDVSLAKELNATGVHLSSKQFDEIYHAKNLGLEVIISTHTHKEVKQAQKLGVDAVTYSPIFESPQKGEPKGLDDLNELLGVCDINVFALGGIIEESHVDIIKTTKAYGFASIRYFR